MTYNSLYPLNLATTTVTINVARNPSEPEFEEDSTEVDIDERLPLGGSVFSVMATDLDNVSLVAKIDWKCMTNCK